MSVGRLTHRICTLTLLGAHLGACGESRMVLTEPSVDVVTVEVSPVMATLSSLGEAILFTATPKDGSGNTVSGATVTWESSDPTVASIESSGTASALANGSAVVTASVGSVEGAADVVVSQVVAAVQVDPATASLDLGDTLRVSAAALDARGNAVIGAAVSWSSSNDVVATVDATGLVTAQESGSATIFAASGSANDDVSLTVSGAPPPPPPPPPGAVLFQDGFEDGDFASRGWYDFGAWEQTAAEAHSGTGSLVSRFQQGAQQPAGLGGRLLFDETESVYFSYWVKYSTNWIGSGDPFNPHEFLILTNRDGPYTGPAYSHLTILIEHVHEGGGNVPVMRATDARNINESAINQDLTSITEDRAANGCNGNTDGYPTACWDSGLGNYSNEKSWEASRPYFLDTPGPAYKNDWHFVETYMRLNTIEGGIGQTDGVLQYWFDGELVLDHQDVLLRTGASPTMRFNQLIIGLWIASGSPVAQEMWIDDLTIATERPPTP